MSEYDIKQYCDISIDIPVQAFMVSFHIGIDFIFIWAH